MLQQKGTKPKLVVLHGLGGDCSPIFNTFKENFENEIVAVDYLYKSPNVKRSLKKIKKEISSGKCILIGSSLGGIMALNLINLRNVKKVIVISSPYSLNDASFVFKIGRDRAINKVEKYLPKNLSISKENSKKIVLIYNRSDLLVDYQSGIKIKRKFGAELHITTDRTYTFHSYFYKSPKVIKIIKKVLRNYNDNQKD